MHQLAVVYPCGDCTAAAFNFHVVRPAALHSQGFSVGAVRSMLVQPRQHIAGIVPPAENYDVAGSCVARAVRFAVAVSEDLDFDITIRGIAAHIELNSNVARERSPQPQGAIPAAFDLELPVFDTIWATRALPVRAQLFTIEIVFKPPLADSYVTLRSAASCAERACQIQTARQ